jgi:menaquinol-cytochrome c reductase iron-sulfur subunit
MSSSTEQSGRSPAVEDPAAAALLRRRGFLARVSALSAAAIAFLVGVPAVRAFVSPGFRRAAPKQWTKVAQADQVDIETPVKVDFVEPVSDAWVEARALRTVWLRTDDGETFTAFSGTCTHLGCSVGFDKQRGMFVCPCHRGVFDGKTGAVLGGPPPRGMDPLPVRVADGEVQVLLRQFRPGVPDRIEV